MAISSDKLLNRPSELHRRYGGRLAMQKAQQEKMVGGGPVSIIFTKKSIKNIELIKDNVVKIEGILKGTIAAEKKALDEKKKKESSQRREKQEEKLEAKPDMSMRSIKMPKAPRLGILDWIKNFIGNIILGYFAYRLIEHLPKIVPIVKFIGNATDFIIDVGGKLLNGLATFIDWGYKAYDATRGFIKNIGGENFAQGFDKFVGAIDTALFLTTVLAADLAAEAMFGGRGGGDPTGGKPRPGQGGRPKVTTSGGGGAGRPDIRNPLRQRPTITSGQGGKPGGFRLPGTGPKVTGSGGGPKIKIPKGIKARGGLLGLVFLIPDLIDAGMLVSQGRGKDGLRTLLSAVSGVVAGMAAYSATLAGAAALGITGVGLPAAIGLAVAGLAASTAAGYAAYNLADAGLKKMGLIDKDPKTGTPYAYRKGGVTRGGKTQGSIKRSLKKTKGKYKRVLAKKPGEVEIKPGADVGGEDKIFGIFPNPLKKVKNAIDFVNPFNVVKTAGEDLGKSNYFGPILAITSKITLGQKPSKKDYENVGLGINMLISKGIQDQQLKGGIVAAFAEGGLVDPDVLSAVETGGDISNWVAKTFQGEVESNAQKTLRMIKENADKKKLEVQKDKSVDEMSPGEDFGGSATDGIGGARLFMAAGFPMLASAILSGNVQQESGWKGQRTPWVLNDGAGTNKGLISWNRSRIVNAEKFLGKPLEKASNAEQVKWIKEELRQYGLLKVFMDPNATEQQLKDASYKYIGWGDLGNRWKYSSQIFTALQRGEKGTYIPGMSSGSMDRGGIGGTVAEYITGDPNTSFGKYDPKGHGTTSNYHDHIGFRDRKTAERAYNFFKSKGIQVTEFLGYNPVGGHASGSLHYSGLAFDIPGAQWGGRGSIGSTEYKGSAKVRTTLKQFLGNVPAYKEGGETLNGPHLAMIGEKGREVVIDNDSTVSDPQVKNMLLAVNQASNRKGVIDAIR